MVVIPPSGVRLLCTLPVYILSNCGTLYVGRSLWFALQCHEDNMVAFGSIALAVFVPFETVKCSIFSRHTPYCKSIHPHPIHPRPCSSKTPCVKYGPNPVRCKPDIIVQHQINRFMQVLSSTHRHWCWPQFASSVLMTPPSSAPPSGCRGCGDVTAGAMRHAAAITTHLATGVRLLLVAPQRGQSPAGYSPENTIYRYQHVPVLSTGS